MHRLKLVALGLVNLAANDTNAAAKKALLTAGFHDPSTSHLEAKDELDTAAMSDKTVAPIS